MVTLEEIKSKLNYGRILYIVEDNKPSICIVEEVIQGTETILVTYKGDYVNKLFKECYLTYESCLESIGKVKGTHILDLQTPTNIEVWFEFQASIYKGKVIKRCFGGPEELFEVRFNLNNGKNHLISIPVEDCFKSEKDCFMFKDGN